MPYSFDSEFRVGGKFCGDSTFEPDVVKNEPMFFNCDLKYAFENGGPITQAFIRAFLNENNLNHEDCVFDSRVHMLMKGWYPCIPGYHHDDVPRGANGQPDYDNPIYRSNHCLGLVNGEICPTEFAVGRGTFNDVPDGEIVYKQWHEEVQQHLSVGTHYAASAPSNKLVYFNDRSWHQGTQAVAGGWRWFGRISWNTDRVNKITNEIRRQVQVYMENPMEGW